MTSVRKHFGLSVVSGDFFSQDSAVCLGMARFRPLQLGSSVYVPCSCIAELRGYPDENEMVDAIMSDFNSPKPFSRILGGVVFENLVGADWTDLPLNLTYKIRLSSAVRNPVDSSE